MAPPPHVRMAPLRRPRYASRVRARLFAGLLALAVPTFSLIAPPTAHADFDPAGRGPKKPAAKPAPAAKKKPKSDEDKKAQTAEAQIAKYTKIALEQPGQPFPVQKLAQLHRERDGNPPRRGFPENRSG